MLKSSDPMSFDDLSAIYRVERKSPTLSAVRKDLYSAMAGLVIDLRTEYEKHLSADPDSIICEGVNQRRKKASSLSKEITEIRMGKIAALALFGARGGQSVLDNLTPEERDYYHDVLSISKKHVGIMDRLSGKRRFDTPDIDPEPVKKKVPEPAVEKEKPASVPIAENPPGPSRADNMPADSQGGPAEENADEDETAVIRILEDLPPFSGPDRNYELSKEDIVRMPKTMAEALIKRDKAVLISPLP
jgi:DNA replication factor GINS